MSQIRALEGPVIDRKRLTSMSSRDVARERNNETFARQIKKRVGILRNVSIFKEMSDEELAKAAEAFAEVTKDCGESVINHVPGRPDGPPAEPAPQEPAPRPGALPRARRVLVPGEL